MLRAIRFSLTPTGAGCAGDYGGDEDYRVAVCVGKCLEEYCDGIRDRDGAVTRVDMLQFGSVYGRHQAYGSRCASSIVSKYDWCLGG